jgi:hypothetical protein
MSPVLAAGIAANLEFLELTFCSTHLQSMYPTRTRASTLSSSTLDCPISSSTQSTDTEITLSLPALRSLKVTLDNATFLVLATWDMPLLAHLSVLSSDFSYSLHSSSGTSPSGFAQFFITHGAKLTQLELGHSSATIEEHYLTAPVSASASTTGASDPEYGQGGLATWCPNLTQFICSADAEWNWQNPDWIAPHVLLPSHHAIEFIGIRDLDKRLKDDMELAMALAHGEDGDGYGQGREFFMLLEQIGSMVRREAFPSLRCIRDMSWGSDLMRKGRGFRDSMTTTTTTTTTTTSTASPELTSTVSSFKGLRPSLAFGTMISFSSMTSSSTSSPSSSQSTSTPQQQQPSRKSKKAASKSNSNNQREPQMSLETKKIVGFWKTVLERCAEGGVCVEDWRGREVRMAELRRVGAGAGAGGEFDHI